MVTVILGYSKKKKMSTKKIEKKTRKKMNFHKTKFNNLFSKII